MKSYHEKQRMLVKRVKENLTALKKSKLNDVEKKHVTEALEVIADMEKLNEKHESEANVRVMVKEQSNDSDVTTSCGSPLLTLS